MTTLEELGARASAVAAEGRAALTALASDIEALRSPTPQPDLAAAVRQLDADVWAAIDAGRDSAGTGAAQ